MAAPSISRLIFPGHSTERLSTATRATIRSFDCSKPYQGELAGCDVSDRLAIKKFVPPPIKALLEAGDLAIARTRAMFPHGAGNLQDTLHDSCLASYVRLANRRFCHLPSRWEPRNPREEIAHDAAMSIATGGGNCGEYAHVAATELNKLLPLGTPIRVCSLTGQDHVLVMVGNSLLEDPQHCVIVDAWPSKSQAVCAQDYGLLRLRHCRVLGQFVADGADMLAGLPERVRNHKNAPALHAAPLSLRELDCCTKVEYWSASHVTHGNMRIDYQADPALLYVGPCERDYFADQVDHIFNPTAAFSQQSRPEGVGRQPRFVQLTDAMRLDFSTLRYRHGTFPQDACSLVRLGISKRTDGAWLPQRWSNYGGRPDYHLETQWGLVDPLVEALYRTGRLSDDWRRVLVADRPTGVESITRYNPRQRFVDQVYFAHGEASDLLLTGKLVVECRSRTYSEVLGVDTPLFISVLQYGDGLIEALDLSWLGEPGDTWCVRTTAGELDTLLPRLAARCTAE